jgi:tetratricopeptide (TPR) repeat protein
MRRTFFTILCFLLVTSLAAATNDAEQYFEQGNGFFTAGEYQKAIDAYHKILDLGYQSATVYFNLGNAYFKHGDLGLAILNYTRARRLDPRDDDIKANLDFARQFTIDKVEVTEQTIILDYINNFLNSFKLVEIEWLSYLVFLLLCAALFTSRIYRWFFIPRFVIYGLAGLLLICVTITGVKYDRDVLTRNGVITAEQTDIRNGPGPDFTSQFTGHAGLTFQIEREEDGYYLANFENRLKGWVAKDGSAEI